MKRSSSTKILTTHVGSLPRPDGTDRAGNEDDATIRSMVEGVVAANRLAGVGADRARAALWQAVAEGHELAA